MAQAKGMLAQLCIDWETTFNSDPSSAVGLKMPINTIGLKSDENMILPATITGVRDAVEPAFGNKDVRGPIVVPVDYIAFGYWLRALLGAPATTQSAAPYVHTFKPLATLPSMVVDVGFTDISQYFKYNGVKMDGLSISVGGDGELIATLELIGASESTGGSAYDATPTTFAFNRFNNFQATLNEGGSPLSNCKLMNLVIRNGLDPDSYPIGSSGFRTQLLEGQCSVTGSIDVFFEDLTLYTKATDNTESSLELVFTSGTNILTITAPEVKYKRGGPEVATQGGIGLVLEFSGFYDDASEGNILQAVLENQQASYA